METSRLAALPDSGRARPRIVAIGGGAGPALVARSLPEHLDRFCAVVGVTDSGSSTGVVREAFGLPAPGDVRAALSALLRLSDPTSPWADLLEFRFRPRTAGQLSNMAVGNLLLAALSLQEKSFPGAVEAACRLLGCRGRVLPACADPAHLTAELADGRRVIGEVAIRQPGKPPIRTLAVADRACRAWEPALAAIREADLLFIGPGNLYTSVLSCLVVPGVAEAIRECRGIRIYIPNTTTYPGQTDGYTVLSHVDEILAYLPGAPIHYAILNDQQPAARVEAAYRREGIHFIPVQPWEIQEIVKRGTRALAAGLLEPDLAEPRRLHKLDTIRHDPAKLGHVLREAFDLAAPRDRRAAAGAAPRVEASAA
jgi:uncharacterized cofD-like protein